MRKGQVFRRMAAALLAVMLMMQAGAMAESVPVSEEMKAACMAAGGQVLAQGRAAKVISPYGTQSVVLRDVPSDSYDALAMLLVGQAVTVIGETEAFCFVLLEDGVTGWLESSEVK